MTTITELDEKISQAASQIAGACYDDASGTIEQRLTAAIDGDLTREDRIALGLLLDALTGVTSDLCDSDTTDTIREATADEAIASALARPEGHILVDGRRCYVSL